MGRISHGAVTFWALLVLTACMATLPATPYPADTALTLTSSRSSGNGVTTPPRYASSATASRRDDKIDVHGSFYGDLCQVTPDVRSEVEDERVTVTLQLNPRAGPDDFSCLTWDTETDFTATVSSLGRGTWFVRLITQYQQYGVADTTTAGVVELY